MFREIDTSITNNSKEFRDDEYDAKPSDRAVLALGDSFTEGWGVDLHESYPKLLALKLRNSSLRIDHVYNAGHYATNPRHYVAVYENHFRSDKTVDLVALGFFLRNDIIEESTLGHFPVGNETTGRNLKLLLSKNSALYNFLRRQVRYSRSLEQIASLLGLTNPPAYVGHIYANEDKSRWQYTGDYILDFYHTIKLDNRDLLFNADDHWNKTGHEYAAEVLYDHIINERVIRH